LVISEALAERVERVRIGEVLTKTKARVYCTAESASIGLVFRM
jgi:hypothetical protein